MTENIRAIPFWVASVTRHTEALRQQIRENCFPYHHWPILCEREMCWLPISEFNPPCADNNNVLTLVFT